MADEGGIKRFYPLVSGVTLAAAAILFWIGADAPIREMPDTRESADPFYCTACEHATTMTPRARAKWIRNKGIYVTRGDPTSDQRAGHRIPHYACPQCEQMTLRVARKCFDCEKVFWGKTCPSCPGVPELLEEGAKKPKERPTRPDRR